jgi:hypothetical protein
MTRPSSVVRWGEPERRRLRSTRNYCGHSQSECAEILTTDFGVVTASQPNVNRWESGVTRRPSCADELIAYCDTYGPGQGESVGPPEAVLSAETQEQGSAPGSVDEFERLASQAAGEPLLGPLQLELIRAMNERLRQGPPLSAADRATYLDQRRTLRLD